MNRKRGGRRPHHSICQLTYSLLHHCCCLADPLILFFERLVVQGNGNQRRERGMTQPSSAKADTTRIAARSSLVDSISGCVLRGIRIDKEELKRRILMPEYLRLAIQEAIRLKDPSVGEKYESNKSEQAAEAPLVLFVNSKRGGRHGPALKGRLQELMGEEQSLSGCNIDALSAKSNTQYSSNV